MKINKAVNKRIRITGRGINFAGDINAAIVVNAEKGGHCVTRVSSHQRVTQRRG